MYFQATDVLQSTNNTFWRSSFNISINKTMVISLIAGACILLFSYEQDKQWLGGQVNKFLMGKDEANKS